jgi:hypothetical protein
MRVFKLVVAVATALFLAPGALHSESLAEAAAKEKARRKALQDSAKKPVKAYNEDDLSRAGGGSGTVSVTNGPDAAPAADAAKPAEGGTGAKGEKSEDEKRAEASAAWRKSLEDANKAAATYREQVTKLQNGMNDTSNLYSPSRKFAENMLVETQAKLKESEAKIADLEEQGRRAGYR